MLSSQEIFDAKESGKSETTHSGFNGLELLKEMQQLPSVRSGLAESAITGAMLGATMFQIRHDKVDLPDELKVALDDLGVREVTVKDNRVTLKLDEAKYKDYPGCPQLWFDKTIQAKVSRNDGTIEIKGVSGLMVNPGGLAPWANITKATFEKKEGICIAKVTGGRFGVTHTQTIKLPGEVYDTLDKTLKANGL